MNYRPLNINDAEIWKQIRIRMLTEHPEAFGKDLQSFEASADEVFRDRAQNGGITGAFLDGELVGVCGQHHLIEKTKRKHTANIWGMYVAPKARRLGVGRELLRLALESLKIEGVEIVYIGVVSENAGARTLYERSGFTVWGTEPDVIRVDGKDYSVIHMYQRI
ncbi:MAG: GNAT family N-acetyltransferase [Planctomycetes bacterium]|nr:GNAT family N-acetyltransferase [Planctomycetota bacterium]